MVQPEKTPLLENKKDPCLYDFAESRLGSLYYIRIIMSLM